MVAAQARQFRHPWKNARQTAHRPATPLRARWSPLVGDPVGQETLHRARVDWKDETKRLALEARKAVHYPRVVLSPDAQQEAPAARVEHTR